MLRLSTNVLYSSSQMLKRIKMYDFSSLNELFTARTIEMSIEDIFEFSLKCEWVFIIDQGKPILTEEGKLLVELETNGQEEVYRRMLANYILLISPIWSKRIPYGRKEATIFMTKDEKACFYEAGLLESVPDIHVVKWWDQIASCIRKKVDENMTDIGRVGELLTLRYEKDRTGTDPIWISIDSNLIGYDIKSRVSKQTEVPLLIEVKTTNKKMSEGVFHISSNEWETAMTTKRYFFYLWVLNESKKMLATLKPEIISEYIPTNNKNGKWESVKIPYISFKNYFIEID